VTDLSHGDRTVFAFRRNVVVAASAGTGKTHRLTALYVLLTLGMTSMGEADDATAAAPVLPDRIVATTFSRAAAREIGKRVEQALRELATTDPADRAADGAARPLHAVVRSRGALLHHAPSASVIRKRAAEALQRWHVARIDTLHGLAKQIAERNALALGLSPDARILDEEESSALGELAVDEALGAALGRGGDDTTAARDLVTACGGVYLARQQVLRLLERLDEEGLAPSELARGDHAGATRALRAELRAIALGCASAGQPMVREAAAALVDALDRQGDGVSDPLARALVDLFAVRAPPPSRRARADEELSELRKRIGTSGDSNPDRARKLVALLRDASSLEGRERRLVELLEDARRRLGVARRRARALSFGDVLRAARDGLRDHADLGGGARRSVDVLLVDEFQDTSRIQRDLVYLLREKGDANRARGAAPRAEDITEHGLFIVGDRKQSIYGFRGADVSVFCRICAELAGAAAGEALSLPRGSWPERPLADFVALRESRRSGPRLLTFVNAFAERDFAQDRPPAQRPREFEIAYGAAEHLVAAPLDPAAATHPSASSSHEGEVVLIQDDGATPPAADPLVRESTGPAREALIAAGYAAREVRALRRAAWRDIAILTRRRSTIPLVELALARLRVPYVVAGRALYEAGEIRDVAALLRLVLDPRDRLALATVLRGPAVALSDDALTALSTPGRGLALSLGRGSAREYGADAASIARLEPDERARLSAFRSSFGDVRRAALRLPPAQAIKLCFSAFDLDRVLATLPRAEATIGNVDRLVAIARRRGGTLASFVHWLEQRIREETDEAEAAVFAADDDAVRLTTIHASKGLDFPIVLLLDLNAEPRAVAPGVGLAGGADGRPTLVVRHFGAAMDELGSDDPVALPTEALRAANADARARESAERRRLTYVAMTRARRALVLVGTPAAPRPASAWRSLTAGLRDPELARAITRAEPAISLLSTPPDDAAHAPEEFTGRREAREGIFISPSLSSRLPVHLPPEEGGALGEEAWRWAPASIAIATTPLALFGDCPRRFRFRLVLGFDEPVATGQLDLFQSSPVDAPEPRAEERETDPRAIGRAAHRVLQYFPWEHWGEPSDIHDVARRLEAEGVPSCASDSRRLAEGIARFLGGAYARELRRAAAVLHREEPFVLTCESPSRAETPKLALRGAIDLLAVPPSGPVDVIDYKRSRPRSDLGPYAFQLRAYALAAARRFPGRPVRAGIVFLGAETPTWLAGTGAEPCLMPEDHQRFEEELSELTRRFAEARRSDRWEGVPVEACRRQNCGFVRVCHGPHA
jgi:ATP-dependent helicase/nuclease subunit A